MAKGKWRRLALSVLLVCGLLPAGGAWAQPASDGVGAPDSDADASYAQPHDDASIIVVYDNASDGTVRALSTFNIESALSEEGVMVDQTLADANDRSGTVVLANVADGDVDAAIEAAESVPGVAYAQPNFTYGLLEDGNLDAGDGEALQSAVEQLPNDPAAGVADASLSENQYYLYGDEPAKGIKGANVLDAWDHATNDQLSNPVTIAVLDTGVNLTHEDLVDRVWTDYAYDFYSGKKLEASAGFNGDYYGHGTHVAGIAAGTANNGVGIAGASYNGRILPLKVFNNATTQPTCSTSTLVQAYNYMLTLMQEHPELNLHVANMSLGSYSSPTGSDDRALHNAIIEGTSKGLLTVCAGGNGDDNNEPYRTNQYPSDWDECFAVTALSADGTNANWSDFNSAKDISAPGVALYSTYKDSATSYARMSGTSMASPLVAGVAALLWAADPGATVGEVVEAIESTADPIDDDSDKYHRNTVGYNGTISGSHGAINAEAAVLAISDARIDVPDGFTSLYRTQSVQLEVTLDEQASGEAVSDLDWTWEIAGGTAQGTIDQTGRLCALTAGTIEVSVTAQSKKSDRIYQGKRTVTVREIAFEDPGCVTASREYGDAVQIEWNPVVAAAGFYVQRADDADDAEFSTIATIAATGADAYAYGDGSAEVAKIYRYRVVPFGTLGDYTAEGTPSQSARGVRFDAIASIAGQADSAGQLATFNDLAGKFVDTVVVAGTSDMTDAVAAAGLAGVFGAAFVAVDAAAPSGDALDAIKAYDPVRVIVVGDAAQVSDAAYAQIQAAAPKASVNRYDASSANALSEKLYTLGRGKWGATAFVVAGESAATRDLLSLGTYAYVAKAPVFSTTSSGTLSVTTRQNLVSGAFSRVVLIGSEEEGASASAQAQLEKMGLTSVRIEGATAYEMSAKLAADGASAGVFSGGTRYFASADAATCLSAISLSGMREVPLYVIDEQSEDVLLGLEQGSPDDFGSIGYFEGASSLSEAEKARIAGYLQGDASIVPVAAASSRTSIAQAKVSAIADQVYTGSAIEPAFTVELEGKTLTAGTDYKVAYENNVNVGQATVKISGTGSYSGEIAATFNIVETAPDEPTPTPTPTPTPSDPSSPSQPAQTSIATATFDPIADQVYAGSAIEPDVVVKLDGKTLVRGVDYDVFFANNDQVGTATVVAAGKGSYSGSCQATFAIVSSAGGATAGAFLDVPAGAWYAPSVSFVAGKGLMKGYDGTDLFGVGSSLTRAELAVIMWRAADPAAEAEAAKNPAVAVNETGMADVAGGMWYTAAANWAVEHGVIGGYANVDGSRSFGPNDPVTAEQMVTIIANYATGGIGDAVDMTSLTRFADWQEVSGWAQASVAWAARVGLVSGYDTAEGPVFAPQENIARERIAKILENAYEGGILK